MQVLFFPNRTISLKMTIENNEIWVITEDIKGMANQALGLAESIKLNLSKKLDLKIVQKIITKKSFFSPYISNVSKEFKDNYKIGNFPKVIISCGRQSIRTALYFKKHSTIIYVQDPKVFNSSFDIIVAPKHDLVKGSNVIETLGTVHRINKDVLSKTNFIFENYQKPHNVVLIGGPNKHYDFDYNEILKNLSSIKNGSVLVTCSRRTPNDFLKKLKSIKNINYVYDFSEPNTYFELLKTADTITVTIESVNMISEACATEASVFLLPLIQKRKNKFNNFQNELLEIKRVKMFDQNLELFKSQKLDVVSETAQKICERINI